MLINKEKAYINAKCDECGKLIYPEELIKVKLEKARKNPPSHWKLCIKCYNKIFPKED